MGENQRKTFSLEINPNMHGIFLQRCCMKCVPWEPQENTQLIRQNSFSLT